MSIEVTQSYLRVIGISGKIRGYEKDFTTQLGNFMQFLLDIVVATPMGFQNANENLLHGFGNFILFLCKNFVSMVRVVFV